MDINIKQIVEDMKKNSTNLSSCSTQQSYECELCKDTEYIITGYNTAAVCKCSEPKNYKRRIERSGLTEALREKTFESYATDNKHQTVRHARMLAEKYTGEFESIRAQRKNSIAFLGQVGAGKSHLCFAIANKLLEQGVGVLYMQYREAMPRLKMSMRDEERHQKELNLYKNAAVLLIDDLYKNMTRNGAVNESDMAIMFEIINHRYLKCLPIIVSSEYKSTELLRFDEGINSRIIEMCKDRIIEFDGKQMNHRIYG